jgi:hypothetical protein
MTKKEFELAKKSSYLLRWCESDGDAELEKGVHDIGREFTEFITAHRFDLPLVLAVIEVTLPLLKNHMDAPEQYMYTLICKNIGAVDMSALGGGDAK